MLLEEFTASPEEYNHHKEWLDSIASHMSETYGVDKDYALIRLHDAERYDYALCEAENNRVIGISSSLYRETITLYDVGA